MTVVSFSFKLLLHHTMLLEHFDSFSMDLLSIRQYASSIAAVQRMLSTSESLIVLGKSQMLMVTVLLRVLLFF